MWNHLVGSLGTVPPGFPETVEVPEPFLHQIDTTFWIWFIRAVLIVGALVCLFYARSAPDDGHQDVPEKQESKADGAQTDEKKVTK